MNIYFIFAIIILVFTAILLFPLYGAKDIPKRQKILFSVVVALFFFIGGFLLYAQFGTPGILPLIAERENRLAVLKEKISSSSAAIKNDPKNLRAWLELGDSFMETSQFAAAGNSYKQAVLLSGGNPAIIMAYARALVMAEGGTVTGEAKKSLDMVLMLQPENAEARYFEAVYKLQSGNMEAMQDMKELYKSLPSDSPIKEMIDRQIGRKD